MKISVALTTYNGGRFLVEQLDSLQSQQRPPDELQVGDDGSTDDTFDILDRFAARASFPVTVTRNPERLGYADNFLRTATRCTGDWIAFCDQDDVWHPDKLSRLQAIVTSTWPEPLMMVVHDCRLIDADGRPMPGRFPGVHKSEFVARNGLAGFSVHPGMAKFVRGSMLTEFDSTRRPRSFLGRDPVMTHDKWTNFQANALGGTYLSTEVLASYRRHGSNASMMESDSSLPSRLKRSLGVGSDYYRFCADVAREYAEFQRDRSQRSAHRDLFIDSASRYGKMAEILERRVAIHDAERKLPERLSQWFRLAVADGGYFGDRFTAMGRGALLKDFAVGVVGRRRLDRVLKA